MSVIQWDQTDDRIYEVGLDRGVLYLEDDTGVAWNGLISVESSNNDSSDSFFFDGNKFIDYSSYGIFTNKIKAFTYPDEFIEHSGQEQADDGLYLDEQCKKPFGLSYRTLIGDADVGLDLGYKIHILYNLTADPDTIGYDSLSDDIDPVEFEWTTRGVPESPSGYSPTAYIIADSRYLDPLVLEHLEEILYGTEILVPRLPPLESLIDMLPDIYTIIITDHGNGLWSADGPDELITMLDETTFQIDEVNAVYLDSDTYDVSST